MIDNDLVLEGIRRVLEAAAAGWPGGPEFLGIARDGTERWRDRLDMPRAWEWELERERRIKAGIHLGAEAKVISVLDMGEWNYMRKGWVE